MKIDDNFEIRAFDTVTTVNTIGQLDQEIKECELARLNARCEKTGCKNNILNLYRRSFFDRLLDPEWAIEPTYRCKDQVVAQFEKFR